MKYIKIQNNKVLLKVNLLGGAYFDFHLKDLPINPINWKNKDSSEPPFMGHFLCFDRWGPSSGGEKINGFQLHGEVNAEVWEFLGTSMKKDGSTKYKMMCSLPMGGLELKRNIELSENEPVIFVTEEIFNKNKYGRMFNIVQHVTLAPPFLDKEIIFDNNSIKGFENKEDGSLNQEEPVIKWPEAFHNGRKVNLRQFNDDWPELSTFIFNKNEKYAWATASNPDKGIMLGYIWKIEDYPWINFWRSMDKGIPLAFGMEFGTTGLHEPFPVVAKKGKIFDCNIYDFIDANETIKKSFIAFLAKIPSDYKGVENIEIGNLCFIVMEKSWNPRNIKFNKDKFI
jgi:hypothetical protein